MANLIWDDFPEIGTNNYYTVGYEVLGDWKTNFEVLDIDIVNLQNGIGFNTGVIGTAELENGSVTNIKLASSAVTYDKIAYTGTVPTDGQVAVFRGTAGVDGYYEYATLADITGADTFRIKIDIGEPDNFISELISGDLSIQGAVGSKKLHVAVVGTPVGCIVPFLPGYFTTTPSGSYFSPVLCANDTASVQQYLLTLGGDWYVCDGTAPNDPESPIFDTTSKYTPNLTDSMFIMGGTAAGTTGGASTTAGHDHTLTHTHSMQLHTHSMQDHTHSMQDHTHTMQSHTHVAPSHTHATGYHKLTEAEMPIHSHSLYTTGQAGGTSFRIAQYYQYINQGTQATPMAIISPTGGDGWHDHGNVVWGGDTATGTPSVYSTSASSYTNTSTSNYTNTGATNTASTGDASTTITSANLATENRPKFVSSFYIVRIK